MTTTDTQYIAIGEAAQRLAVSIDTIRRWEQQGKITAYRTPKGIRLFATTEIARLAPTTQAQRSALSVSQAANYLGVSAATLRRWDRQGLLIPKRSIGNERAYDKAALDHFIKSTAKEPQRNRVSASLFLKETAEAVSDTVLSSISNVIYLPKKTLLISLSFLIFSVLSIYLLAQATKPTPSIKPLQVDTSLISPTALESDESLLVTAAKPGHMVVLSSPKQAIVLTPGQTDQFYAQASNWEPLTSSEALPTGVKITTAADVVMSPFMSGTITMAKGQSTTTVAVPDLSSTARVVITTSQPDNPAAVTDKKPGLGFVIRLNKPADQPITIDWIVVK